MATVPCATPLVTDVQRDLATNCSPRRWACSSEFNIVVSGAHLHRCTHNSPTHVGVDILSFFFSLQVSKPPLKRKGLCLSAYFSVFAHSHLAENLTTNFTWYPVEIKGKPYSILFCANSWAVAWDCLGGLALLLSTIRLH